MPSLSKGEVFVGIGPGMLGRDAGDDDGILEGKGWQHRLQRPQKWGYNEDDAVWGCRHVRRGWCWHAGGWRELILIVRDSSILGLNGQHHRLQHPLKWECEDGGHRGGC